MVAGEGSVHTSAFAKDTKATLAGSVAPSRW
jgi:hypothetical protein